MTREALDHAVRQAVARILGAPMSAITPEAHLISDLGSNDLLKAELLMELEDAYEIECPDDVAEAIRTPGDLTDWLAQALGLLEISA